MSCEDKMKERFEAHAKDGLLHCRDLRCLVKEVLKEKGLKFKDFKDGEKPREMFKGWDDDDDKMLTWEEFEKGPMKRLQEMIGECNE